MYIYRITEKLTNKEGFILSTDVYLTHKNKISKKEFTSLCASVTKGKILYDIKHILIRNHGFQLLPIEQSFDFYYK